MFNAENSGYLETEADGRLIIPAEVLSRYGIKPGGRLRLTENQNGFQLQSAARLAKLYIEPTNLCNLDCRTCIRNIWTEPMGRMSGAVFARIVEGLKSFSPPPKVFFGGFGEPLFHPGIIDMIRQVKASGCEVELITNGTLLTRDISRQLIRAGLDMLWVSLDGATPQSYTDIRLGAALPQVLENLNHFREATYGRTSYSECAGIPPVMHTKLGIAFVAMKRNIADLPAVIEIGQRLSAEGFMVTNVLPYTKEMVDEALYYRAVNNGGYRNFNLPGIDINETTYMPVFKALQKMHGNFAAINSANGRDRCPFVENGSGAVSWDGNLSPCLPLMHSHTSYLGYLHNEERYSRRWLIGNLTEHSLSELWYRTEHVKFRERVQSFAFSPCSMCGNCEFSEKNEEDCSGNNFPTCGGCLWAQGVIQCP
jgi:MoaA/NifB/PqqE/SkfB family radical SAM enzyme